MDWLLNDGLNCFVTAFLVYLFIILDPFNRLAKIYLHKDVLKGVEDADQLANKKMQQNRQDLTEARPIWTSVSKN